MAEVVIKENVEICLSLLKFVQNYPIRKNLSNVRCLISVGATPDPAGTQHFP
jgi:hypothetical protein